MSNELSGHARDVVPAAPHLHSVNPPVLHVLVRGREAELFRLIDLAEQRGITVWWIRWHDERSFATQMLEIAETIGLPARHRLGLPDLVWTALAGSSRWLLVIDNVDQPGLLSPTGDPLSEYRGWVRANGSGLLLVTSRDADPHQWGPGAELITLEPPPTPRPCSRTPLPRPGHPTRLGSWRPGWAAFPSHCARRAGPSPNPPRGTTRSTPTGRLWPASSATRSRSCAPPGRCR